METDVSMQSWGAVCAGAQTGGLWSQAELDHHINYLELLAAMLAVKAFTKSQEDAHIRLCMDNRTAVCYVNHMGGTWSPAMSQLAIQLWQWCLRKNLSVYLPGTDNCIEDRESRRTHTSAEGKLKQEVFQRIMTTLGNCSVDLFASRLNVQLEQYVSS